MNFKLLIRQNEKSRIQETGFLQYGSAINLSVHSRARRGVGGVGWYADPEFCPLLPMV